MRKLEVCSVFCLSSSTEWLIFVRFKIIIIIIIFFFLCNSPWWWGSRLLNKVKWNLITFVRLISCWYAAGVYVARSVHHVLKCISYQREMLPYLTGCRARSQSNLKSQIEFQIEIQCSKSTPSLVSLTNYIFDVMSFTNLLHLHQPSFPWHSPLLLHFCSVCEEMYDRLKGCVRNMFTKLCLQHKKTAGVVRVKFCFGMGSFKVKNKHQFHFIEITIINGKSIVN